MKLHKFNQRLLQPLKTAKYPRYMYFTDTETHPEIDELSEVQKFSVGWIFGWDATTGMVYDSVNTYYFKKASDYCKYFSDEVRTNKDIYIYGHNLFFDLQCAGFFKYFTDEGWQLDWLYDKGLTYILRIKLDKLSVMCLSTTNYFDCSLKDLGALIGLKKKDISFATANAGQLKRYCFRDTEIVMRAIWYYMGFIQKHELGRMAFTKASQGFVAYRYRFMNKKIYLHKSDEAFKLERNAYMGGRVEAFRIGRIPGDDFVMLDVNSMYPYVMDKYKYPYKLVARYIDEPFDMCVKTLNSYGMIAEVELNTDKPVFAVRYKGKLIFPVGQFSAYLCTEGLKYALEKGYITRFVRANVYLTEDLFSNYVEYFRDLRESYTNENNKIMVKLCKYMHNAFYGKWGEKNIITEMSDNDTGIDYLRREIYDQVTASNWVETYFMNKIIMQHTEGEGEHSFPAITAHITENARLVLWNVMEQVGTERVLYCDTDSIIIHRQDMQRVQDLIHHSRLGGLKMQKEFNTLIIDGAKNYRTDGERVIKGIPKSAVEIRDGVFTFDSFQRQVACMRAGQITGVRVTPVTRSLTHGYDKGVVTSAGFVEPYRFEFLAPLP